MSAKIAHIIEFCKPSGVFVAFHSVFLWCFVRCFCGISSGILVVFHPAFLWHFVRHSCGISSAVF